MINSGPRSFSYWFLRVLFVVVLFSVVYIAWGAINHRASVFQSLLIPQVVTQVYDVNGYTISGRSVVAGTPIHDVAIVSPEATSTGPVPTGKVNFSLFNNGSCTEPSLYAESGVVLNAAVASSTPTTTPVGTYSFFVNYSGDVDYTSATATCEYFTVAPGSPSTTATLVTRTPGFWQGHTSFTEFVFNTQLGGSMQIGNAPHKGVITTYGQLFGAFYAGVSTQTDGTNRSALGRARMQLLEQLVAAKLNCATFGCSSGASNEIAVADTAYAGNSASDIFNAQSQLDTYNNSGDTADIPATLGSPGNATPKTSQSLADLSFWDNP